ncbi:transposase is4 [Holotrichia oblita]|uniref:Transposase is4 n=1 Tax=Holotrichia oblita TaxID=644536 RepID=A0ACB9TM32_HOLOL|nr:transposase is4 [Holotrichia oblita]
MASTSRRYYFSNENDAEELGQLRLMEESDNDERILTTEEESDTDASVSVEDREGDSETEQSKSDNNEVIEDSSAYYTAVQKQRNKIVATWEWKKFPFSQRRRTPSQNVIVRLPGVIGDARKVKGVYETWQVLINDNILNDIVRYTNQYIERIQTKFTRTRDDRKTHIIEIKAFIGLLYLAGVYHAN